MRDYECRFFKCHDLSVVLGVIVSYIMHACFTNIISFSKKEYHKIVKMIKDSKLKVQAQIQGDEIRVTGKSRDDLQAVMAMVRGGDLGQPFQFKNFRD